MARAHFVKKARKDHPEGGIKKGDSYWWWAFMVGGRGGPKHYSKTQPKASQLTQSEYLGSIADIQDELNALGADDGLQSAVEDIASRIRELGEEQQSKKDNLPDSLQESETGQLLEERAQACESAADELEAIEFDYTPNDDDDASDDDKADAEQTHWDEKLDEVQGVNLE